MSKDYSDRSKWSDLYVLTAYQALGLGQSYTLSEKYRDEILRRMKQEQPRVNPAVATDSPEFMTAIHETARLLQDALSTIAPLSGSDKIMVDYHDWDTMCNTLAAIREKWDEWAVREGAMSDIVLVELNDLLKKAGY